jgi:hypothetical protein
MTVAEKDLYSGDVSSCGCLPPIDKSTRNFGSQFTTHGMSGSPEYKAWQNMKQRCTNPNDRDYKNYGGRGIKICDRWLDSFQNFYDDMGKKPAPYLTIEREDNDVH